ncbi:MAG: 2'-5' RNA ligase family protein [Patescibacteria group bacterium]
MIKRILDIENKYKKPSSSNPHITLIPPAKLKDKKSERGLVDRVTVSINSLKPFAVNLKEVGYFGNRETIYIKVDRDTSIVDLQSKVFKEVSNVINFSLGSFIDFSIPHITLVKGLSPEDGYGAWKELSREDFSGQFICDKIVLLKKRQGHRLWCTVDIFKLG